MKRLLKLVVMGMIFCLFTVPAWGESVRALMMATTTSTDNTGLLEYLVPEFTRDTGIEMKWVATGTGNALKLGENCDVDVLMVHAPAAEKQFVADGFGVDRKEIMYNDFVLIGPGSDPAQIKGKSVSAALNKVVQTQAGFVSRGDNSGTHKKELFLWQSAGLPIPEAESWYVQAGQGMLATINMAGEKNGYTMTDRGTYIKYEHTAQGNPKLKILVEGDDFLKNQYSVMAVNPDRCENVNYEAAVQFSDWITGEKAQNMIAEFKLLDKTLFIPNAR
ncbi:substrate-binding domain-containing protein [Desulfotignum balticum]|uniref:Putative ABC transporter periplasmic protein n=1 Tax=Desulfotignum balticum TaxID=115781 RepID=C4B7T0_9BACT|nr:substrate-binding domain-containing protein [Desulfotignum balticum]BAH60912.1 putative ABC transporter periplasmic protein [Desulfotignum balticum]